MIKIIVILGLAVIGVIVAIWDSMSPEDKPHLLPRWALFWVAYLSGMALVYGMFLLAAYHSTGKFIP